MNASIIPVVLKQERMPTLIRNFDKFMKEQKAGGRLLMEKPKEITHWNTGEGCHGDGSHSSQGDSQLSRCGELKWTVEQIIREIHERQRNI